MGDDYADLLYQLWFAGSAAAVGLLVWGAVKCRRTFRGKR